MTTGTNGLCRAEGRTGVARLATDVDVRAVQYKAGTKMVKLTIGRFRAWREPDCQKNYEQQLFHGSAFASRNELSL